MSDQDSLVWYINISPVNRYLLIDVAKALAVGALILLTIQILPLGNAATVVTTIIVFGLVFWGVALVVKLFTSFTGLSIRFILNDEGATAMADEGKIGLSYVARQVSSMRWDPMHGGSMRASNIQSEKTRVRWGNVSKVSVDEPRHVITLHKGSAATMRLYCSDDNYENILDYVQARCRQPVTL